MTLPFVKAETWLHSLQGEVDLQRISTPIKVEGEEEIEVTHRKRAIPASQYDFIFSFRGTHGKDLKGTGRLFIPRKRPRERLPMVVSMHYEMDANGSARFLARGAAVMTPHGPREYTASNLMGHGVNHSVAMARMPRRLPFVDQDRVVLFGGSAGGYHALMASSFVFPVTAVFAAVPPLNLKFNINWLLKNDEHNVHPDDPSKPIAPVVRLVKVIATETAKGGNPRRNWTEFSPVYRTRLMTSPTMITYSTADVLVPVEQLSKDLVQPPPPGVWPEGFRFEMEELVDDPQERASLAQVLSPRDYTLKKVHIPRDSPTIERKREDMQPEEASRILDTKLPWSRSRRFSICLLDEGPMDLFCGHTKYHHVIRDDEWWDHHLSPAALHEGSLNLEKLTQLMERFSGQESDMGREYGDDGSWPITRLDQPHIERWYVANGLELYAGASNDNTARLIRLYRRLPKDLKVLDLGSNADSRLESNPVEILLHHQLSALVGCGDLDAARATMRRILSANETAAGTSGRR
jgi:hypothetical protein